MMRASVALALMASLIFAGCLGGGGGGLDTSTVPAAPSSSAPAETSDAPAPSGSDAAPPPGDANRAPEASLSVQKNQSSLPEDNGVVTIESEGSLTFDASASSDPDGDALTYEWVVDGVTDPDLQESKVTIEFSLGTHVVEVVVSDGSLTDSEDVTVQVGPLPTNVPEVPTGSGGSGAVSYQFGGEYDGTVMAGVVTDEEVSSAHEFVVPAGAQKLLLHLAWVDNVSIEGEELGSIVNGPVGNLDVALTNAAGTEIAVGDGLQSFEYVTVDAANLTAGTWSAVVSPVLVAAPIHYKLDIVVFLGTPTDVVFIGSFEGQQALTTLVLGLFGESSPVDGVSNFHNLTVPAGVQAIVARLEWQIPDDRAPANAPIDLDLFVMVGEEEVARSAYAYVYEFAYVAGDVPAGAWVFEVSPFTAPAAAYSLTIEYA